MTLVKTNNRIAFPSLIDEFLKPDWMGGMERFNVNVPAVNIKETDTNFVVELAAPGKKKEDFNIELDDNVLTISSEASTENEEKDKDGKYTRKEFSYSSFKRAFTLPEIVNEYDINASYENGVLHITLPKREEALPKPKRMIEIG
ncbi:Hsp20/alpha crystallin family protein [Flavobacterium sp.]|jgi:HSP20 family protein|uniref:Hsp20/alpha crystallin family protein n=1 Tax=Flavobacterium sp. TaxID=239 RepID=UPI0037BFFC34